jgi:holo-[acyl-carrier protein] synthase
LGVDVTEVDRVQSMIDRHAARFLAKVFTPSEVFHSVGRRNRAQHLAARFAAKEAAMKALGTGLSQGLTWHDFEISTDGAGKPHLVVTGAAQKLARARGIGAWYVSLTHTRMHAAAVVLAMA